MGSLSQETEGQGSLLWNQGGPLGRVAHRAIAAQALVPGLPDLDHLVRVQAFLEEGCHTSTVTQGALVKCEATHTYYRGCWPLALDLPTLGGCWEEAPFIIGAAPWTHRLLVINKQTQFRNSPCCFL